MLPHRKRRSRLFSGCSQVVLFAGAWQACSLCNGQACLLLALWEQRKHKPKGKDMYTTLIHVFDYSLGNHYAIAQNEDKEAAIAETVSRASEIFTPEFLASKKPYEVSIIYPSGKRKVRIINKP